MLHVEGSDATSLCGVVPICATCLCIVVGPALNPDPVLQAARQHQHEQELLRQQQAGPGGQGAGQGQGEGLAADHEGGSWTRAGGRRRRHGHAASGAVPGGAAPGAQGGAGGSGRRPEKNKDCVLM